jgi:dTDP-glucose pyrophosphorylase
MATETKKTEKKMIKDHFERELAAYFQGHRDGYAQALGVVEHVLDDQTNKESNRWTDNYFGPPPRTFTCRQ